jgi:cyclophilin family peptidyl-prolyl cis-trans isomerase
VTRKHGIIVAAVVGLILLALPQAWTAEPKAAEKPQGRQAEFDRLFAEWKKGVAELHRLQQEHRSATPEQAAGIEKRHAELVQKMEAMLPKLAPAAEAAYLEAPNADKELGTFLLGVVMESWRTDNYEEALRLSKVLLDHGFEDKMLQVVAGWSAFCSDDFDLAGKYLGMAKESGLLEKLGQGMAQMATQFLEEVPFYQKAWKKEQELRAAEAKADDLPRVLLKTTKGEIEVELFENEAPDTVANFISLVQKKYYDGTPFHRVLGQFMAQGGDPTGSGGGGPGYAIPCECYRPDYRVHFRGTLSMAHAGRDTGGSQFFLTFRPTHHLDGKHTAFGRVTKGMDVLSKLQRIDPQQPNDKVKPDKIVEATVLRKRPHPYEPKTLPEPNRGPRRTPEKTRAE